MKHIFILVILAFCMPAYATTYRTENPEATAYADAAAAAQQQQQQQQQALGGTATASNDGVTVGGDRVENNSSNVILVPNNNTESCLRVFGIAFGKNGESAALGIPWRSAKCDYEQAADDAFAGGERELGWFWKCHNKSLYKPFRAKGETVESAIDACLIRMLGPITLAREVAALTDQLNFLENERKIERQNCTDSKDRINEAWKESCAK